MEPQVLSDLPKVMVCPCKNQAQRPGVLTHSPCTVTADAGRCACTCGEPRKKHLMQGINTGMPGTDDTWLWGEPAIAVLSLVQRQLAAASPAKQPSAHQSPAACCLDPGARGAVGNKAGLQSAARQGLQQPCPLGTPCTAQLPSPPAQAPAQGPHY